MKRIKKVIMFLMIILVITNIFSVTAIATPGSLDETINSANGFINMGKNESSPINDSSLKDTSNYLYNTLLLIGIAVALIWGLVLGIKFITGSVEQKVDVKKGVIAYLVGCIIVFGAFGIWKVVLEILQPLA